MYLAALIGYMAKRQIHDLYQAQEAMTTELVAYYSDKAYYEGISFDQYIDERVALKVRQYGSGTNNPTILDKLDEDATRAAAEAYRKASRGG